MNWSFPLEDVEGRAAGATVVNPSTEHAVRDPAVAAKVTALCSRYIDRRVAMLKVKGV